MDPDNDNAPAAEVEMEEADSIISDGEYHQVGAFSDSDDDDNEDDDDSDDDSSVENPFIIRQFYARDDDDSEDEDDDVTDLMDVDSSDDEQQEDGANRVVVHSGVTCDECGMSPIRGAVYHSTRIIDYDICPDCYEDHHKHLTLANAFLVFKKRKIHFREDGLFENPRAMRVNSYGWASVEQGVKNNPVLQNLDINLDARFRRHANLQQPSEEGREVIKTCIANSTALKVIYAKLPSTNHDVHSEAITALLDGISASRSIITLSLTLDFTWQSAIEDLCRLIRNNKSIRFLFVQHWKRIVRATNQNSGTTAQQEAEEEEQQQRQNELEQQENQMKASAAVLFRALGETSVHSFSCKGISNLGEACRTAAVAAVKTRPSLKRIKANFLVQNDELQRLMEEKKHHWMRDWNDPAASNESRVQVLEEILSCKQVDEQDQVAALFHFVRSNPGSLPELDEEASSAHGCDEMV